VQSPATDYQVALDCDYELLNVFVVGHGRFGDDEPPVYVGCRQGANLGNVGRKGGAD
jgi:hypothetical protein